MREQPQCLGLLAIKPRHFLLAALLLLLTVAIPKLSDSSRAQIPGVQNQTTSLHQTMAPGTISGVITDEAGNPLSGMSVSAYQVTRFFARHRGIALTNELGEYRIGGLGIDAYTIEVSDPVGNYFTRTLGRNDDSLLDAELVYVDGRGVTGVDLDLEEGANISGRIQLFDGFEPTYMEAELYLVVGDTDNWQEELSIVDGAYRTGALPPGTYAVCVYVEAEERQFTECNGTPNGLPIDAALVALGNQEQITDADITIGDPANFGTISGVVTDADGSPLAGTQVWVSGTTQGNYSKTRVVTDVDGSYELPYVVPGTYMLRASSPDAEFVTQIYADAGGDTELAVAAGQLYENINFAMEKTGKITGTVSLQGDLSAGDIIVTASPVNISPTSRTFTIQTVFPTGQYEIYGAPPGEYRVSAELFIGDLASGPFGYFGDSAGITPVVVVPDETTDAIDIALDSGIVPHDGVLAGQVTHQGEPLAGIHVNLHNATFGYPAPLFSTETDSAGNYRIEGLHRVARRLSFVDPTNLYATVFNQNRYSHTTADDITMPDSFTLTINAEMVLAGGLAGVVRNGDDTPASNVDMCVARLEQDGTTIDIATIEIDDNGGYAKHQLAPGDYILSFMRSIFLCDLREHGDSILQQLMVTVEAGRVTDVEDVIVDAATPRAFYLFAEPLSVREIYLPITVQ